MTAQPKGEWVSVPAGTGVSFDAWLCRPASPNGQAIILLQEIFGVNAAIRAQAEDFAAQGYLCLAPDLFWRLERRVDLAYDREGMKAAFALLARFEDAGAVADVAASAAYVAGLPGHSRGAHLVGFCLGGKVAAISAGQPHVASAVAFYGVDVDKRLDALAAPHAPLQMHFGGKDKYVPAESVAALRAFAAGRPDIEIHLYPEADHGFFGKGRHSYDAAAAEAAWTRARAFMTRQLKD